MTNPISRSGMTLETSYALIDVQDYVNERGHSITIELYDETTITRDKFNSLKKRGTPGNTLSYYAYPLVYSPNQKQLDAAGIRESVDVMLHTAMKDWNDDDYTMQRLEDLNSIKGKVIIDEMEFEIKEKSLFSQFGETHLYVVIGANKI